MTKINDFMRRYAEDEKISMVTCYDYWSAKIIAKTEIDAILVGDTSAMIMHGHESTVYATPEMLLMHLSAVKRGADNKFIIADLPFLSYRKDMASNMQIVENFMQAGAHAVKLEGVVGNIELIRHLVDSGVPVMGHIGVMPQSINTQGSYRLNISNKSEEEKLMLDAIDLAEAGCFGMVLECVPALLAKHITETVGIATIGIGSGPYTAGQILVLHDLLGLYIDFKPAFVKTYFNGALHIQQALQQYNQEIKNNVYPETLD